MLLLGYRTAADWQAILDYAASFASPNVTLRQLHYVCVSNPELGYRNTLSDYQQLSRRTADLRRFGEFPALADLTRSVVTWRSWASPGAYIDSVAHEYHRDYTEGQETLPLLLYEKATLTGAMEEIAAKYMVPHAALRGYSSETLDSQIQYVVDGEERPVRVLYCGDFDSDGADIERNAQEWIDADEWTRVCVTPAQINEYGLPQNPGKPLSSRRSAFLARYGVDIQVEVEALPPDVLVRLVEDALLDGWDTDLQQQVVDEEAGELARLQNFVAQWDKDED